MIKVIFGKVKLNLDETNYSKHGGFQYHFPEQKKAGFRATHAAKDVHHAFEQEEEKSLINA